VPVSWQARLACVLLRRTFKRRLAAAQGVRAIRRLMNVPVRAPLDGVSVAPATLGGIVGEWLESPGRPPKASLLYLHGGGYIACSPRTHRAVTTAFAHAGYGTFAPDYRLAPEHPFPAALEDALAAYRALLDRTRPRPLFVAGDSAGGGLSLALLLAARERGWPLPTAVALFSPLTDLVVTGDSIRQNAARCAMFVPQVLERVAQLYLGRRDPYDPLASPLYGDLRGLPPLLIHVGRDETLLDDSVRLAQRVRAAAGTVELEIWPAVPHAWQLFHPWIPEGRRSLAAAATFFDTYLHGS